MMFQDLLGPVEERVEVGAGGAEGAGEGDAREEHRLRLADVRGGGGERLLGLADVGTPVEQLRRQPGGHRGRAASARSRRGRAGSAPGCGPSSTESSFSFAEIRRSRSKTTVSTRLQLRLGLAEVQLRRDAALEAVLGELHVLAARLDRAPRDLEPAGRRRAARSRPGPRPRPASATAERRASCGAEEERLLRPRVARRMRPKKSISQDTSAETA